MMGLRGPDVGQTQASLLIESVASSMLAACRIPSCKDVDQACQAAGCVCICRCRSLLLPAVNSVSGLLGFHGVHLVRMLRSMGTCCAFRR